MFRPLNSQELDTIRTLQRRGKAKEDLNLDGVRVDYSVSGNNTVAVIMRLAQRDNTDNWYIAFTGVAKYNPKDAKAGLPYSRTHGEHLAFTKAFTIPPKGPQLLKR